MNPCGIKQENSTTNNSGIESFLFKPTYIGRRMGQNPKYFNRVGDSFDFLDLN